MNKNKINISVIFCESTDDINVSLNNIFNKIKLPEDGKLSFDIVLLSNIMSDQEYILHVVLCYHRDEKGNEVNKYHLLETFKVPPERKNCTVFEENFSLIEITNGINIINLSELRLEKGDYLVEIYAIPQDNKDLHERYNKPSIESIREMIKEKKLLDSISSFKVV